MSQRIVVCVQCLAHITPCVCWPSVCLELHISLMVYSDSWFESSAALRLNIRSLDPLTEGTLFGIQLSDLECLKAQCVFSNAGYHKKNCTTVLKPIL